MDRRHRYSAEDLSVQLKSAQTQTVQVFVAYARDVFSRDRDPKSTSDPECERGGGDEGGGGCTGAGDAPATAAAVAGAAATAVPPPPRVVRPCHLAIPLAAGESAFPEVPSPPLLSPTSAVDSALQAAGVCPRPRSLSTSNVDGACACVFATDGVIETTPCTAARPDAHAQAVARRLIEIGDSLDSSLVEALVEAAGTGVPLKEIVGPFVRELTWENVVKLFGAAYRLIERQCDGSEPEDARWWTVFDDLWNQILTHVSRWILQRGGWSALLSPSPGNHHSTPFTSPRTHSRHDFLESGVIVEDDEMASPSEFSIQSSPSNLLDSGLSLANSSHDVLNMQGLDEDFDGSTHFERHRSRSLPPNRRERRRSVRQSLDGTPILRGALLVYQVVMGILRK